MTRHLKRWLVIAFLILVVTLLVWFKLSQPRILVIQSYDPDYAWTRDVDIGLRRVLDGKLRYKVEWHYMNTKNHPDADFKRRAGMLAVRKIEDFRPDIIIAVDDDAQQYAVKSYADNPKLSIVFAGINASAASYGYDRASNVTGIVERKPLLSLRNMLSDLRDRDSQPLGKRLVHIGDRSGTSIEDNRGIEAMDWTPFRLVASKLVSTFDDWKSAIADASSKCDLILVSHYRAILRKEGSKELVPPDEIIAWTEANAPVPVVAMSGFAIDDGVMLAMGTSGFEQGETSARMASEILDQGKPASQIPHTVSRQYLVYIRQALMEKRGLTLPDIYEAFSRASNNYH